MAIIKQASNIGVQVSNESLTFVGDLLEKTAERVIINATSGNIEIKSTKKIYTNGNRTGG